MKMPDFYKWAKNLIIRQQISINYASNKVVDRTVNVLRNEIQIALKQAFDQGCHLGRREGYEEGLNRGWAIEQDKDSSAIKQTLDNLKKAFPNGFHNPED